MPLAVALGTPATCHGGRREPGPLPSRPRGGQRCDRLVRSANSGGVAGSGAEVPREHLVRLDAALSDAGVDHRCEIYVGAQHGWTMADFPVYDETAAERHWRELLALFDATLTKTGST
jgi:acetyl esterase/lipase